MKFYDKVFLSKVLYNMNIIITITTIAVAAVVKFFIFSRPFSREEIEETQVSLDQISETNEKLGLGEKRYEAENYLEESRNSFKGMFLMITSFIAMIIILVFFKNSDYILTIGSAILFLGLYGLAVASNKNILKFLVLLCLILLEFSFFFLLKNEGLEVNFQDFKVLTMVFSLFFVFFWLLEIRPERED